jgi:hypothetical protein
MPGSIKVGGSYNGIAGEVEYTFNPSKSQEAGKPILDDSTGKTNVIVEESELMKLWDMVKGTVGLSLKDKKPTLAEIVKYLFKK